MKGLRHIFDKRLYGEMFLKKFRKNCENSPAIRRDFIIIILAFSVERVADIV
jgi:hypothetical protein